MLSVSNLSFTHGEKPLFQGVSFAIETGRPTAIVGPSGSGKSTLIQVIAGLLPWQSGNLTLFDHQFDSFQEGPQSLIRNSHMGIIFQDYNLLPALSVADNLRLRLLIADQEKSDESLKEALDRVGMADFLHASVKNLSGGQQQRVALTRALITQPKLILADEPTGNLDDRSADLLLDALFELNDTALLIATHDQRVLGRPLDKLEMEAWT